MRVLAAASNDGDVVYVRPQIPNGTNLPVFRASGRSARTPHDPTAFTQGLQFVDGTPTKAYGLNGRCSSIRKVKLETGEVLEKRDVPSQHFGEGITIWQSDLIELTWQSEVAFVYDKNTLQQKRTFSISAKGGG